MQRIGLAGKFFACGTEKFVVRGVTYGPFRPRPDGSEYHTSELVTRDFRKIAACGFNTVRTYTVPPRWLLDLAEGHGLRVMVGLPWEQHVTFLDQRSRRDDIERRVGRGVKDCSGHPAVFAFVVGNEIPPSIVRWYGRRKIERFLKRLYDAAKLEDPQALVTYVNFPTTEYLELPFVDFAAFNVFLETPKKLKPYLARLQNLADGRPLVTTEVGLDSLRNGEHAQAESLDWQVRSMATAGCAGTVIFSWTDEWYRSGREIEDWRFGLTDRERTEKPALKVVAEAVKASPLADHDPPGISVVLCSYNGGRTIRETLERLQRLRYPDFEVIVVDDGSTDSTAKIAGEFPVRLISTENHGLSHARNVGMHEARGEIIAYIDDDAYPDPDWLSYLAYAFRTTDHAGIGGPNLCPPTDCETARCVAHAPGGPNHVLLTDTVAEHIPGCNMAFRARDLRAVGGFDEKFRIAGDDVDLCWRIQAQGGSLGFHPGAMVWHHHRDSVRAYLRQQYNYGRAEAMLELKWPRKYNSAGYPRWQGRVYGRGQRQPLGLTPMRVYHGVWGSNLFQSIYSRPAGILRSLPLLPEWYLLIAGLAVVSLAGAIWPPLLLALPLMLAAIAVLGVQATSSAMQAQLRPPPSGRWARCRQRLLIGFLHLVQPIQRLRGRLSIGLTPFRRRTGTKTFGFPWPLAVSEWSETWMSSEQRLEALERRLGTFGARTVRGGEFDRWDLEIRGGLVGGLRVLLAIEEHGSGRQLVRLRSWPVVSPWVWCLIGGVGAVAGLTFLFDGWATGLFLSGVAGLVALHATLDCAAASAVRGQLTTEEDRAAEPPQGRRKTAGPGQPPDVVPVPRVIHRQATGSGDVRP